MWRQGTKILWGMLFEIVEIDILKILSIKRNVKLLTCQDVISFHSGTSSTSPHNDLCKYSPTEMVLALHVTRLSAHNGVSEIYFLPIQTDVVGAE